MARTISPNSTVLRRINIRKNFERSLVDGVGCDIGHQ